MENPGVIAQANLEALVIKRLSWPQPDQPLGLGIQVPPRHDHLKLMIDAIVHLTKIFRFLNQYFARLRCWKKCLKFTKPKQLFCWRHFSKTEVVQNTDLNILAL